MLSTFGRLHAIVHKALDPFIIINIYTHTHCADACLICLQICFVISATRTFKKFSIIAFSHLDIKSFIFSSFLIFSPFCHSYFVSFVFLKEYAQPFSYLFSSSSHHGSSGLGPRYLFRFVLVTGAFCLPGIQVFLFFCDLTFYLLVAYIYESIWRPVEVEEFTTVLRTTRSAYRCSKGTNSGVMTS